jgi:hypothetical protein
LMSFEMARFTRNERSSGFLGGLKTISN